MKLWRVKFETIRQEKLTTLGAIFSRRWFFSQTFQTFSETKFSRETI